MFNFGAKTCDKHETVWYIPPKSCESVLKISIDVPRKTCVVQSSAKNEFAFVLDW